MVQYTFKLNDEKCIYIVAKNRRDAWKKLMLELDEDKDKTSNLISITLTNEKELNNDY